MSTNNLRMDYIEFVTTDVQAAKRFYTQVFGWEFKDYGPQYAAFKDGRIEGGFRTADEASAQGSTKETNPLVCMAADDLEDVEQRVKAAGGTVTKNIYEFPGGRRFHFADPTGLQLAVWSTKRRDGSLVPY
ncbi:hypothetical protein RI367_007513 [Sorochytrium milnesiophthora]